MTDAEIMKALKIHTGRSDATCKECVFYGQDYCRLKIAEAALDLINRQKAEIERLTTLAKLGNMRANDYRVMRDRAIKAEAEIERLEKQLNSKYKWENMLDNKIKEVKTEAIKEFAERLKDEMYTERGFSVCPDDKVDNLVKEMVGDTE